jgi:hypothetical protein
VPVLPKLNRTAAIGTKLTRAAPAPAVGPKAPSAAQNEGSFRNSPVRRGAWLTYGRDTAGFDNPTESFELKLTNSFDIDKLLNLLASADGPH